MTLLILEKSVLSTKRMLSVFLGFVLLGLGTYFIICCIRMANDHAVSTELYVAHCIFATIGLELGVLAFGFALFKKSK